MIKPANVHRLRRRESGATRHVVSDRQSQRIRPLVAEDQPRAAVAAELSDIGASGPFSARHDQAERGGVQPSDGRHIIARTDASATGEPQMWLSVVTVMGSAAPLWL